jgi:antitoxin FitA
MYYACMVALQIRDVPESVRDVLAAKANERGQSLNAFLRELVLREAAFENNRALLDEIRQWRAASASSASGDDVLDALDAARAAQDAKNVGA